METESATTEQITQTSRRRGRRGRRSQPSDCFFLFRNTNRWTGLSVDSKYVGPLGLIELTEREMADERVTPFISSGKLQLVAKYDSSMQAEKGRLLVDYYKEGGMIGDILVSRSYAHGDIFLTAAFLDSLKAAYPGKRIVFHTSRKMEPLVRHYAGLEIIADMADLQDKLRHTGLYIDLTDVPEKYEDKHAPEISRNRIEILCDYANIDPLSLCPSYYMSDGDVGLSDQYTGNMRRPFIGLSPSSIRKEKSWRLENWRQLAMLLSKANTVFIFDAEDKLQLPHSRTIVPVIGKTLRVCGAIASQMDMFVTQDSLWTHWAAALGIPQVLLASCTDGKLLSKGYPDVRVIQRRDWTCCPCWYLFQIGGCHHAQYPQCLDNVDVQEVLDSVMGGL